jgi:ectoine hydroxylase-related dioxygenase (phytanoyl-CoA dioxygenase family)
VGGFTGWSVKEGVPHVNPPRDILEHSLTLRVHLDPCPEDNGALRVLPGSHTHGHLSAQTLYRVTREADPFVCSFPAGGLLLMRPLLLHSSSTATQPSRRRVLHLEFCSSTLPQPLQWWEGDSVVE